MTKVEVGQRIKEIRLLKGMTLEQFGRNFNPIANKGLVSGWELGKFLPHPKRLKVIAELGNTTVDWLMYGQRKTLNEFSDKELLEELERRKFVRSEV